MKALILGSKGSLGQEFLELYGNSALGWDREQVDITDEAGITAKIAEAKPEMVINCAAYNDVDGAEENRSAAENINGYAVGFVAKACNGLGIPLVHFSTNYVFDGGKQEGYNEDDIPNPRSAYGKSKLLGEIELQKNTDKFYLIRTAWLYGKPGMKKSFVEVMLTLGQKGQPIEAIEDEFASPTYTKDLAEAVAALVKIDKPFGIYHLTNAGFTSWYDWAKEIFAIKNIEVNVSAVEAQKFAGKRKAARPKYGILNNTKFIELRPWAEALKEYLET
ncbi:MAG: dTDP-4-dehydrorhamnose reductase [Candidatus Doudnabacteria bacterium]|nr:dTDP-4-dehydrorhamnose reductase [Candidatus Doudnabacteria bacterium]